MTLLAHAVLLNLSQCWFIESLIGYENASVAMGRRHVIKIKNVSYLINGLKY